MVNGRKSLVRVGLTMRNSGCSGSHLIPDLPKHQGLTIFVVEMERPGITVRPLRQMTGEAFFNEVFLDEVEVRDDMRIGDVGQGWRIASSLLSYEGGRPSEVARLFPVWASAERSRH